MEVKRLMPDKGVLRELYLKSGNQCAFPGCHEVMIDSQGHFVGEICHIEGAMPGGERFNPKQSNEERRAFSNLMLLCRNHHATTNDVNKYTVPVLSQMKIKHEEKFTDIAARMLETVIDYSNLKKVFAARSLNKINKVLEWNLSADELKESIKDLNKFVTVLQTLPKSTRQLLSIMVKRGKNIHSQQKFKIYLPEIEKATSLDRSKLIEHLKILEQYNLAWIDWDEGEAILLNSQRGWPLYSDFNKFCIRENRDLAELIVDLDFSILD